MPIISPKIPQGLEELMRGLAKSVIKENPENIYEFAAEYFENLLRDRDGTVDQRYKQFATYKVYKKNKVARKQREKGIRSDAIKSSTQLDLEQGSSSKHNSDCESIEKIILPSSTPPKRLLSVSSESEINTSVKQEAFADDEGTPSKVNNDADDDIENMVLDEEMAQAALKIQSTFRGHRTRRDIIETKALPATIKSDTEDKVESQKGSITEEILACDVSEIESEIVHNESGQQQEGEIILNDAECNDVEINPNQNLLGNDVGEENYEIIESDEHTALEEAKSIEEIKAFDVNSDAMNENSIEVSQEAVVIEKEMTNIHEGSSSEEIQTVEKYEEENFSLKLESVENETEKPDQQNIENDVVVDDEIANMVLDEEMEEAALKIQSAFRGHKVRKGIETVENVSTEEHVNASALDEVEKPLIENSEQAPETVDIEGANESLGGESKCEVEEEKKEGEQIDQESQQPKEIVSEDGIVNIEKEEGEMLLEQIEPIDSDIIDIASSNVIELNDENLMNEVPAEIENSEQDFINEVEKSQDNELPDPLTETNDEKIITEEEPALITNKSNDDDGDAVKSDSEHPEAVETISVEEGSDNNDCITVEYKTTNESEAPQMKGTESIKNSTENLTIEANDVSVEKNEEEDPLAIELDEENNEKNPSESNEIVETDVPKEQNSNEKVEIKSSEEILPHDNNEILESNEKATGSIECNDDDLNIIATEVVEQNDGSVDETVIENNDIAAEMRQASCEEEKCEIEGDEQQPLAPEVDEGDVEVLTNDDTVKQISVEEEICEQKIITILEPEQSEKLDDDVNVVDDKLEGEIDVKASLEKMSSTEIKYEKLHESVDGKLSPSSLERHETEEEEKSIDADSVIDSKHASVDVDNDKNQPPCESVEKEAIKLEKILQQSVSPMDLIDEVVNEVASAKAHEMFQSTAAASSTGVEEIIQPEIINLISEEEPKNEDEIVNDEILKPDEEESEIPEETQNPIDETLAIVEQNATDENVAEEAEIINEKNNEEKIPDSNEEENLDDMVLDEEMEDAALKIQAAFRGHKSRRETTTSTVKSDSKQTLDEENEKQSDNNEHYSNIVIDQCSPANEETQENDDNEQQDTSADIDEIQESEETEEQQEQEEEEAETEVEEKTTENETENEVEDDGNGGDDPSGEGETDQAEGGSETQNNDDDDVANMVLDEEMEQAALKIQSTFRGHKTRKEVKTQPDDETKAEETEEPSNNEGIDNVDDDVANMVLDEEMAQAALKIQSTFRGHKSRKDNKNKDDENAEEEKPSEEEKEEEKEEEEKPKEEEPQQSTSSTEKSAKQLQDEEDIAGIVMDEEMEKTALKIQSAFRGKIKRKPKDGMESCDSSAEDDGSNSEENNSNESLQKSDENPPSDMYEYFGLNNENASDERGNSYDEVDYNNYSANRQSYSDEIVYSVDHYDAVEQRYDETIYPEDNNDINLMQGGGIFVDSSKDSQGTMCTSSNEDKDPSDGRDNSIEKKLSQSFEVVTKTENEEEKLGKISEEKVIESFDFDQNKDTAEALYYSLKKSEIEAQKRLEDGSIHEEEKAELKVSNEDDVDDVDDEEEDDNDVVMINTPPSNPKILKYGMSMDDRLLGSILSQDYSQKPRKIYPDDGFDLLLEESMRNHPQFLERFNETSRSEDDDVGAGYFGDDVGDDEDQFDDFFPGNIRTKIMASSISIADSDCFDPTNNKSIIDDTMVRTALETIHSTDSESTIASATTKIHAGERHNLMTRRNNNQYSSIGNAAIDKSLDDFIQSQEFRVDRFDEEAETSCVSPPPQKQESNDDTWTSDTCTESDKKHALTGIIGIKMEQKQSHFLTIDERRRTLHREDAIQRNSTRSNEEDSSKSSSSEKIIDKINLPSDIAAMETGIVQGQSSIIDTEIAVPVLEKQTQPSISPPKNINKTVKIPILRQKTMPVQIESNVIRVLPKHLRKRIKSAESSDKKRKISK